ncbi:NUAK family SNF1-like kinase 1 like protein [Argiope bruennichi]|uniref:NUAK family SNF1-like kinase 1 like protein n=1 Tax=Argiope bruennichi TaxID=94029 RepID=A0A8T0EFG0_ARGBR|nr:NUAK family SNF1-like kinase 1 like protein [Argiope bruennichi]
MIDAVFENKEKIVLVMQFAAGGELFNYLFEKKVLSDNEARRIFRQIASAVYYCHKNKICHRDLKLENVLLDEKGNAKITDFGLSNVFDEKNLLNTYCGSPLYASPEIVTGVPYYGPEVDCWSMGVVLYTLVYGAMPFDGSNFKKLVTQISEADYYEPKNKSGASDLIRKLLTVNPSKRATIVDICVDYWIYLWLWHLNPRHHGKDDEEDQKMKDVTLTNKILDKDIPDEEEEEEEVEDYNADTAASSFAFMKGSRASQLSVSSPNLQEAVDEYEDDSESEFLPADIAALQAEYGFSIEDSLPHVASLAKMNKKCKSSSSTNKVLIKDKTAESINEKVKDEEKILNTVKVKPDAEKNNLPKSGDSGAENLKVTEVKKAAQSSPNVVAQEADDKKQDPNTENQKGLVESKKFVRPPGKIIIPKTFESPQTTPSPKAVAPKKLVKSESKSEPEDNQQTEAPVTPPATDASQKKQKEVDNTTKPPAEDVNKNISEVSSSCSTPVSTGGTPEPMPSFYKAPKPYTKEEETNVMSKAEIKLSSTQSSNSTLKNEAVGGSKAPLWDAGRLEDRQLQDRNCNWSTISSTIDSEMSNWREQMEESLRRLSPDDERSSIQSYSSKVDDDKPLVPIARSYKKFTFTKDGACITETKKIYTTPGADGSWTKVEKKTKITTRPGNAEEFEKFRDLHLRTDSASVTRSDSQSSSGSNEVYDDIFDSWTGDTMMCNMRKMNNLFQKFSRDPFMRRERRRNPFRFFRRTESERNERDKRKYELRSGRSSERESENEEDYDVHYDDNNAVVYGSQGLWQFLRSANRGFPNRVTIQHEPASYGRSMSQDRSEAKCDPYWKRCGSRASSGYNTGTRSQSRDRTESPREKMLRFVFDSPRESFTRESSVLGASPTKHEKWSVKRNLSRHNPRRDSGVGSDGYESEYSIRQSPSDEMSRAGRVSSMSSICSDKQGVIRNFMRSWSKSLMSPPMSPTSMGSAKEQLENLPEARKHRVEQWLDMNSGDVAFGMDHSKLSSRKSSASHGSSSPSYATMRPREYLQYNRSSSDKLADCADFFPSFDDNPRRRSHSLNKDSSHGEMGKVRFRSMAYSPVSEESFKDAHSAYHSDGSHSGSSVHRINFTISDGRMSSSSHGAPQTTTRYIRQFSSSKDGSISVESSSPTGVRVEQISGRSPTQPVVQMRVSISRGNRENPVISSPPHASKGLWEQQDSSRNLRQDITVDRSPSPVPGIRQFSTEVQHCIGGNVEAPPQMSVQCEVTNPDKQAPHGPQIGKSSPYKLQLPAESSIWDMAAPPPCMDINSELTNINKHDRSDSHVERYSLVYNDLNHRPKNLPSFKSEYDPSQTSNHSQSQSISSNGANTPDSLEDLSVDPIHVVSDSSSKMKNGESYEPPSNSVNGLRVDVKPLGVLWSTCSSKTEVKQTENKSYVSYKQTQHSAPSSVHSDESGGSDKQRKCLEKTSAEIGSIWNQKNSCHTFDLLKNLLSDDGLESFSSSKCVLSSSHSNSNRNNCPDLTTNNENTYGQNPVLNDKRIAVIDNIELEYGDKFHKMPSLMDDLQSPKEVLRQAMKICESLNKCN